MPNYTYIIGDAKPSSMQYNGSLHVPEKCLIFLSNKNHKYLIWILVIELNKHISTDLENCFLPMYFTNFNLNPQVETF